MLEKLWAFCKRWKNKSERSI